MKKLICLVVMLCGLSIVGDEQGYLTGTNTIELAEGESLIVLCFARENYSGVGDMYIGLQFPPYDSPAPKYHGIRIFSDTDLAGRTIPGPCKISKASYYTFGYKKTSAEVFANPMNVIMIPVDYEGDLDISLEASTDLQNWTPVYSGSAGTSGDAAFFRTRLIQN